MWLIYYLYDLYLELLSDYDKVNTDADEKNFLAFSGSSDREKLKEYKKFMEIC